MSFQKEKREIIKRYLLEKIRVDDDHFIEKTAENFSISITTVKRYLNCNDFKIRYAIGAVIDRLVALTQLNHLD